MLDIPHTMALWLGPRLADRVGLEPTFILVNSQLPSPGWLPANELMSIFIRQYRRDVNTHCMCLFGDIEFGVTAGLEPTTLVTSC